MHFTLCDLVADIAQNAAESGANEVHATLEQSADWFRFALADNGRGMTDLELAKAKDPFHSDGVKHPGRKVGLGIPFLVQTATVSGGEWSIDSRKGSGTTVRASFDLRNVDTPPLGDVPGLIRTMFLFAGPDEWVVRWIREGNEDEEDLELRKTELAEAVGGLESAAALNLLDQFLRSQ